MKITLNWLKQYLETNKTLEEICQALTNIGLEVESCNDKSKSLKPFFVAEIIEAEPVENSVKLKKCLVKVADNSSLQVICGAKNARKGIKVAFAPIGAVIPANQMIIKKAKIAGIESNGMICSASELLLGEEGEGIKRGGEGDKTKKWCFERRGRRRERERLSFFKCVLYRRFEHRALRLGVERRIGQRGKRGNEGGKKKASFNSLTFCFRIFLIRSFVFCLFVR